MEIKANKAPGNLAEWLEERCRAEHLSNRQAGFKMGVSHATIDGIRKGVHPTPETIRKLAQGVGGGEALVDYLLTLAGYRAPRPEGEGLDETWAHLIDKVGGFSKPQMKLMVRFADFLIEVAKEGGASQEK